MWTRLWEQLRQLYANKSDLNKKNTLEIFFSKQKTQSKQNLLELLTLAKVLGYMINEACQRGGLHGNEHPSIFLARNPNYSGIKVTKPISHK